MELDKIKQNKVYEMAGTLFALRLQLALFPLSLPNPQNNLTGLKHNRHCICKYG